MQDAQETCKNMEKIKKSFERFFNTFSGSYQKHQYVLQE